MPLVNYEGDSSGEEDNNSDDNQPKINLKPSTSHRLHLPTPAQTSSKVTIEDLDDEDESSIQHDTNLSSGLLSNLPKPLNNSTTTITTTTTDIVEDELEDIVRGENKEYAKNIPQMPKPIKRKRDGPVKIFLPTIEHVKNFAFILISI